MREGERGEGRAVGTLQFLYHKFPKPLLPRILGRKAGISRAMQEVRDEKMKVGTVSRKI